MTHKEYNGWYNYESWLVSLWIDNEESSQAYWAEQAQEAWDRTGKDDDDRKLDASCFLAASLKDHFEESNPCTEGFWADLMGAALSEVNWHEIAENMLEEISQEQPAPDSAD